MLSTGAFNALLKTLEEPPKHVVFILATTEPYKLPNTILSRCQRFDFQAISVDDILRRLKIVAEAENVNMSEEAFNQIAASAEGGMRDALSLFDQTISYSVNEQITLDDVLAVSGNVSYIKLIELLNDCLSGENTSSLKIIDEILKQGKEEHILTKFKRSNQGTCLNQRPIVTKGTKVKNIRLVDDGVHNIDCNIPGFGAMSLKSEYVKKA